MTCPSCDINQVIGVQSILLVDVDAVVAVAQCEDDSGVQARLGIGGHNRVHAIGQVGEVAIGS